MNVITSDRCLFVDVDDTLIIWEDLGFDKWHPHQKHIDMIKRFHARGQPVIVWSAGGYEWALEAVRRLGLEEYVHTVMSKPAWYIDDLRSEEFLPEVNRIYLKE